VPEFIILIAKDVQKIKMLKYFICLFFWLLNFSVSHAQDLILDLRDKKLNDFISVETNLGDERIENSSLYYSGNEVAQPVRYRRKEHVLPDLIISCYYYSADSTIYQIIYEWEVDNSGSRKSESEVASPEIIRSLIEKYKVLNSYVSKIYGNGEVGHNNNNDTSDILAHHYSLERGDKWVLKDSIDIDLYTILSNKFEKHVSYTIGTTYRIRLIVKNPISSSKRGPESPGNIILLDSVLNVFVTDLKNKDFKKARLCLSEEAAGKVTDALLQEVSTYFKNGDSLVMYISGTQFSTGGGPVYPIMQYRFKSDLNSPPKELIKVVFNDKNKILEMRRIARQ
jgi:hypothetical protein